MLIIAIAVVLVLLAVAVFPNRRREPTSEPTLKQSTGLFTPTPAFTQTNLREQQLREEADAIATEFRRRADEVWLAEVREKAATLLSPPK